MTIERFALMLTTATLIGLAALRVYGVTGNLTDSEPRGLYLQTTGSPTRGHMVQLRPLIKHIAGLPGDTVQVTPQGSYINGHLWPNSAPPTDTHGYIPFRFGTYKLAPGQYWVLAPGPLSWDSRFLGPVPWDAIAFDIKPLWTTPNRHAPGTRPSN
jgi:type IV secretory pathway protease TraF